MFSFQSSTGPVSDGDTEKIIQAINVCKPDIDAALDTIVARHAEFVSLKTLVRPVLSQVHVCFETAASALLSIASVCLLQTLLSNLADFQF